MSRPRPKFHPLPAGAEVWFNLPHALDRFRERFPALAHDPEIAGDDEATLSLLDTLARCGVVVPGQWVRWVFQPHDYKYLTMLAGVVYYAPLDMVLALDRPADPPCRACLVKTVFHARPKSDELAAPRHARMSYLLRPALDVTTT